MEVDAVVKTGRLSRTYTCATSHAARSRMRVMEGEVGRTVLDQADRVELLSLSLVIPVYKVDARSGWDRVEQYREEHSGTENRIR